MGVITGIESIHVESSFKYIKFTGSVRYGRGRMIYRKFLEWLLS